MSEPAEHEPAEHKPAEHKPEVDEAERRRKADAGSRGAMAGVLGLEALVVLLLPRALAASDSGLGTAKTLVLVGLAIVLIVAAGMMRRSYGVAFGGVMQLVVMLTGIWLTAMFVLTALFWAVWYRILVLRRDVVGTPRGLRMLIS